MKHYYIEIKLGARWNLVDVVNRQTDALHYVKENKGGKYPYRIIRVERTIVFDGSKS